MEWSEDRWEAEIAITSRASTTRRQAQQYARGALPPMADDEDFVARMCTFIALTAPPGAGTGELRRYSRMDLRAIVPDIVDSTSRAAELGDARWSELHSAHLALVRSTLREHRGREVDSAGDGVFAMFDGPARAVACARALVERLQELGIEIRAGVHTGEVDTDGSKVVGIAVHIGARICALAGGGEILVSSTVRDLVAGSDLVFADRGVHELKGVPQPWQVYGVER
jgi:class 3 adenylate cyclase